MKRHNGPFRPFDEADGRCAFFLCCQKLNLLKIMFTGVNEYNFFPGFWCYTLNNIKADDY